ncbi:AraC family transcriptional regulator [Paenibacillus nasutitermitis]|uniref:AraC family transcriptional regulator n=1 Tax=Paenibacillus nasutitermitis TaxID=1652958 RepID=A0A916Z7D0_9BACL|nr:helix-turn-helix domain-containing protein [Paenibacillus nasutitermitis]GGD79742.1 AraC family transcriptional regulator [Paenibacillus nasutitermitis]
MDKNHSLFSSGQAAFADCGSIVYSPGGRYGPRFQNDVQLVLLHTGQMDIRVNGSSHTVMPGHVILLKPGYEEYFEFAKENDTWHRWIAIRVENLTDQQFEALSRLPFQLPISAELNKLTDIMSELKTFAPLDGSLIRHLGLAALHLYASEHLRHYGSAQIQLSVNAAKKIIHERYAEDWSLNGLARCVNVAPEHLVRLFRQHDNTTPIKYLWSFRVRQAIDLLTHTGLSISEIAERCGFKTAVHFSRCVRERMGKSPSDIRKAAWQNTNEI